MFVLMVLIKKKPRFILLKKRFLLKPFIFFSVNPGKLKPVLYFSL